MLKKSTKSKQSPITNDPLETFRVWLGSHECQLRQQKQSDQACAGRYVECLALLKYAHNGVSRMDHLLMWLINRQEQLSGGTPFREGRAIQVKIFLNRLRHQFKGQFKGAS